MYELFKNLGTWLTSADQWPGPDGIAHRLAEHLQYSLLATLAAAVIALPLGLLIGHTGARRVPRHQPLLASAGRCPPSAWSSLVFLASGL